MGMNHFRTEQCALLALVVIVTASLAFGQQTSPQELVRQTVNNEIASNNHDAKFMYLDRIDDGKGSRTHLKVETSQSTVAMLVAINDKPLTPDQKQAENARLQDLMNNTAELKKKQKSEREDTERTNRIMRALPDAFLYTPDGTESGTDSMGKAGAELVRLKFRPNPNYRPPTRTEQVLTGMQGIVLIDTKEKRVAKIDGTLIKEVGFGWGIFGHLDEGGHFLVQQADIGSGDWEMTREDLSFTGKILLLKNLSIKSSETASNFKPAPGNLTFAQGIDLAKKHESELAENHPPERPERK
jgi:hypothetical protein